MSVAPPYLETTAKTWDLPWPRVRVPVYRELNFGSWSLKVAQRLPGIGYFQDLQGISEQDVLLKGNETWMTSSPMEIESQALHVAAARGHVVVMGAGLGVALYNILSKPQVTHVTLVERDPDVMDLLRRATDFDTWAGIKKLEVEIADAFDYRPNLPVNHLYIDIWAMTGDPQALPDTQRIQRQVGAEAVSWWSQEIHFLCWLEDNRLGLSLDQYQAWARDISLPLIEQDRPAYMACVARVARSYYYRMFLQQYRLESKGHSSC